MRIKTTTAVATPAAPPPQPENSRARPAIDLFAAPAVALGLDAADGITGPWGKNTNLTILLHGLYDEGNRVYLTEVARAWRRMLPGAQVGFAASEIEKNLGEDERDFWKPQDLAWIDDRRARLIRELRPELDFLVEGKPMPILPPLKYDTKINNCNKMIASVQAGLSVVDTPWVLRIRADAMIRHAARIGTEYDLFARHVGTPKAFRQPVAISPYYTINPFGIERMTFHVSDWYNIGLTDDVRDYWNVATMDIADATYFEGMPHAAHSNRFERTMRARLPPEMMIGTTFAARHGYRVPSYFNELGFESESLTFLRENFVMPDPDVIGMSMGKYSNARKWILTSLLIISPAEWRVLAEGGEPAFRKAITGKLRLIRTAEALRRMNVLRRIRQSRAVRLLGWVCKS